jgi:beta-lactamase regulating signal transducer with metallopeptidase domain
MSASPVVQTWSQFVLAASWQAAVLALLVLLCERMHWLRSPRVRHSLWWFVLLAPLALAPARLLLSQRHAMVHLPAPAAVTRVTEAIATSPPPPAIAPAAPAAMTSEPAPARPFPWGAALFTGWLLGCAAMALRLVVGHWRVRRMLHESTLVEAGAARTLLDELCAQAGVRAALRQSATISAAMLCGLRRPTIVVPRQWLTDFAPTELRALLAHEVAHLRRRDLLAMLAQRVAEIPLFFHPAVWAAARLLAAAREELCDAWAIAQGADPAEYARCLTRVAARAQTRFPLASVGLAEGKSRLRQRVEAILGSGNRGAVSRRAMTAVVVVLVVCAIGFAAVRMVQPGETQRAAVNPQDEAKVIQNPGPLSGREADEALQQLGLHTYRLTYELPFEHRILVQVDEYRHGKFVRTLPGHNGGARAGESTFLLFTREADSQLSFSGSVLFGQGDGAVGGGMGEVSLKGIAGARYYGRMPVPRLEVGKRTPFWSFCADPPDNRPHQSPESAQDIPRFVAEHDLALIAYVTLTRTEEQPASEPSAGKGAATLDLTVLFRDGKPVPGATITLRVQTKSFQVLEHGKPAPRTGTWLWDLTTVLGKTDRHGKATVTIPPLGPGTPLLVVTYHDPRTANDLTAKCLLTLQPATRTSATVTIPSDAMPTIQSASTAASVPSASADRALLDLTVVRADGKPAAGAALTVEGRMPWEGPRWQGKTDAHGKATVVIDHPAPGTRGLRVTYRDPARAGKELTAVRLLILSPGTRTSAAVTVPSGGAKHIESAPRNAEEAAARAQRDAELAARQARRKAKQAEEKTYWQRRRAEVAALSPAARRAEVAKVQAQLHQIKAKARPLEAREAELDKLERDIVNRLREIEAESPGAQTPEGMALRDRFNKITAEWSAVDERVQPLLDQRTAAERELTLLQQAKDA